MAKAYWDDLTTEDFRGLDRAASVVLFPVAATEQHGPHLPLSTDACIGRGIVARALELAPGDLDVLVCRNRTSASAWSTRALPARSATAPRP